MITAPILRTVTTALAYLSLILSASALAAERGPSYTLAPGEYELSVEGMSRTKESLTRKGGLSLREWHASNQVSTDLYPLYGWTNIDFKDMGAPFDAASIPPASQDPENPGVIVFVAPPRYDGLFKSFKVRQASGAPILLIGTVDNRKDSRGVGRDGGGMGLFVQGQEGQCLHGQWTAVGPVKGSIGRFKICPRRLTPEDASDARKEQSK
jgi:hypothetical protein